jgi:hypothetical protein
MTKDPVDHRPGQIQPTGSRAPSQSAGNETRVASNPMDEENYTWFRTKRPSKRSGLNFVGTPLTGGTNAAPSNSARLVVRVSGPSTSFKNVMAIPESKPYTNWTSIIRVPGSAKSINISFKEKGKTQ